MLVIFTDLDGTLLDYAGYQFTPAGDSLDHIRMDRIPLVFVSSKTFEEQKRYQREMGLEGPLVVEDGSAVVLPRGRFGREAVEAVAGGEADGVAAAREVRQVGDRTVLVQSRSVEEAREALDEAREETGVRAVGFSEMTPGEISRRTGLPEAMALRAGARRYSETVEIEGGADAADALGRALEIRGMALQGGPSLSTVVSAGTDKGRGVRTVLALYTLDEGRRPETAGIGDGWSDVPMLEAVDRGFLVERSGGGWIDAEPEGVEKVDGVGPRGWERAVRTVLGEPVKQSRPRASIWKGEGDGAGT